jgi:hypothetical protein
MAYKVIDNFLSEKDFEQVRNVVFDMRFPWGFCASTVTEVGMGPYDFQFVHVFCQDSFQAPSQYFQGIYPLIKEIDPAAILRVKANLIPRTPENFESGYHVDCRGATLSKSAVYYLDTTNGPTRFKDGTEVECVANRIVIFDNDMEHTSVSCTDQKARRVINLNYYELI